MTFTLADLNVKHACFVAQASQLSNNQKLTTALNSYRVTVNTDRDEEDNDDSDIQIQAAHSDAGITTADITAGQVCARLFLAIY